MKCHRLSKVCLSAILALTICFPAQAFATSTSTPATERSQESVQPVSAESSVEKTGVPETTTEAAVTASSSKAAEAIVSDESSVESSSISSSSSLSSSSSESSEEATIDSSDKDAKETVSVSVDKIEDANEGVAYKESEVIVTYRTSAEKEVTSDKTPNALEVTPTGKAIEEKVEAVTATGAKAEVKDEAATITDVIDSDSDTTIVVAKTPENMSVAQTIEALEADPSIEKVEPNNIMTLDEGTIIDEGNAEAGEEVPLGAFGNSDTQLEAEAASNDPYVTNGSSWYLDSIKAGDAWKYKKTNNSVAVAVLDTGCNTSHADLKGNIVATYDATTGRTGISGDSNGHGTHVAGIISARSGNGIGASGTSYNANLVCINVFRDSYSYDSDVINAYKWLIDQGAAARYGVRVINMSLGTTGFAMDSDSTLAKYIDKANAAGIVTVCSAGNTGRDEVSYPADYKTCVSVMSLKENNALLETSTRGSQKDIAAPGSQILSTTYDGGYGYKSGTSMAAPVVSGALALEFAANPSLSADQAKQILYNTATRSSSIKYGAGMVNEEAAIKSILGISSTTNQQTSTTTKPSTPEPSKPANSTPSVSYTTHVQNIGWQKAVSNGQSAGTSGRGLRLEAIKMNLSGYSGSISYRTHVQNIGWQSWVSNGALSGTSGRGLRLEGIQIKLSGEVANNYSVYYRVHAQNVGWMGWAQDGESAGTAGYSYRLEAIQVKILPKGSNPSNSGSATTYAFYDANMGGSVSYSDMVHVQNKGNVYGSTNGSKFIGTTGSGLRLEGMTLKMNNAPLSGSLQYSTHIQNIGWQRAAANGGFSGTKGKAYRLEAVTVSLTGAMSLNYDVYYRTHVQNIGWTGWAKNGQQCGSQGYSYRMEAMQIMIVPKNSSSAPGANSGYFYKR